MTETTTKNDLTPSEARRQIDAADLTERARQYLAGVSDDEYTIHAQRHGVDSAIDQIEADAR